MPAASRGEVWLVDFGLAAKVRPALLLRRLGALNDAEMGLVRAAMAKRFAI